MYTYVKESSCTLVDIIDMQRFRPGKERVTYYNVVNHSAFHTNRGMDRYKLMRAE